MAGIYIHIPFCKSRCIYCGFYSTTRSELRQRYVDALCRELQMRGDYLKKEPVHTIYIGGGTPSQLSPAQMRQLFLALDTTHAEEVTIECNPDDLTPQYVEALGQLPVNRVSMGAQTFSNERLRFLRRRHSASHVPEAVRLLRQAGIRNISIDLMYGFPEETIDDWHRDIDLALALNVEHISAYSLMYEECTPLYQLLEQGKVREVDEELSLQMYSELIDRLCQNGYEHYEISNFAKAGYRSRHNSSYWNQTPYLGIGAAAHSFDGNSRQWNVSDIDLYIRGIEQGEPDFEREELDTDTRYNDMVMTALRTCEGLDLSILTPEHQSYCTEQASRFITDGLLTLRDNHLVLTRRGLFVSNMVMSELMAV